MKLQNNSYSKPHGEIMFNNEKEWFNSQLKNENLISQIKKIKLVIADIDGALTDNKILISDSGDEYKSFSIQDGYAITKTPNADIHVAFLSGRNN